MVRRETGLDAPRRLSGPPRNRNVVSSSVAPSTELTMYLGDGGKDKAKSMLQDLLATGEFDDVVKARAQSISDGSANSDPPPITMKLLGSGDEILQMQASKKKSRARAEKNQSTEEVANNPASGTMSEDVTDFDSFGE